VSDVGELNERAYRGVKWKTIVEKLSFLTRW